jgi:hypothetical protein
MNDGLVKPYLRVVFGTERVYHVQVREHPKSVSDSKDIQNDQVWTRTLGKDRKCTTGKLSIDTSTLSLL